MDGTGGVRLRAQSRSDLERRAQMPRGVILSAASSN
jgi:hypothetical protein